MGAACCSQADACCSQTGNQFTIAAGRPDGLVDASPARARGSKYPATTWQEFREETDPTPSTVLVVASAEHAFKSPRLKPTDVPSAKSYRVPPLKASHQPPKDSKVDEPPPAKATEVCEPPSPKCVEADLPPSKVSGSTVATTIATHTNVAHSVSEPVAVCPPSTTRSNFAGSWMCVRVEGDWNAFLSLQGIGFMQRKMAQAMSYGAGKQTANIEINGDSITITNNLPPQKFTLVSGAPPELFGDMLISAIWADNVLVVTNQPQRGGPKILARRWIEGEEMFSEILQANAKPVRRIFKRM